MADEGVLAAVGEVLAAERRGLAAVSRVRDAALDARIAAAHAAATAKGVPGDLQKAAAAAERLHKQQAAEARAALAERREVLDEAAEDVQRLLTDLTTER